MQRAGICLFTFLAAMAAAGSVEAGKKTADSQLYPGIIDIDDRKPENAGKGPWQALGQVNIAGYRQRGACTGTLIGPRLVLTTGHCVIDPVKQQPYPMQHIHFAAGAHGGKSVAHSVAQCVKVPPGHVYKPYGKLLPSLPYQRASLESLRDDLAVIVLKDAISDVTPLALASEAIDGGAAVSHAGYATDKRFVLSVHRDCKVMREEGALIYTDCDTHAGAAGGPLLVWHDGGAPAVAGVLAGMAAKTASIFVPVHVWSGAGADASCP
jgi:protease YdgD